MMYQPVQSDTHADELCKREFSIQFDYKEVLLPLLL